MLKIHTLKSSIDRPWGFFVVVDAGHGYWVKRVFVKAGHRLSYQSHQHREEVWIALSGRGEAIFDKIEQIAFGKGNELAGKISIPVGVKHRVKAETDLVFIEVAIGDLDEADIVRYEDDYGREETHE